MGHPTNKLCLLSLLIFFANAHTARADEAVSFRNQVMAVFARAGCNAGTCHGNLNGKGGFKLSLRGQHPSADFLTLTRDAMGRRLDRQQPADSLILKKATATVPHEGGVRFPVDSTEYKIIHDWIAQGARDDGDSAVAVKRIEVTPKQAFLIQPKQSITIQAKAVFADGGSKDIGHLAVFESSNPMIEVTRKGFVESSEPGEATIVVRYLQQQGTAQLAFVPARPNFVWEDPPEHNFIDTHVFARLKKLRMNPSDLCSDNEFIRRAYIDLLGLLPEPKQTRAFLADDNPKKRAELVDKLLERPEFPDYWALRFSDFLRNEPKQLDKKGTQVFYNWIRDAIAKNQPLHLFARELIAGRGSTYTKPAANYYRALRDPYKRAEATAQVFLGLRMQCAKCHNHPFNIWTQNDYHQFAAFFSRVKYKIVENKRKDRLDKHEFIGEQIVWMDRKSEIKHPVTGKELAPKFLGGEDFVETKKADRLQALAEWVGNKNNALFARTQANRIWSYLMGRGIVEPNDDFRDSNPPTNGPLLDSLAKDFADHDFDLKHLIRTIMNSRTYQLSALPNETNEADKTNFSHALIRSIPAEPLLDAVMSVSEVPVQFDGYPLGTRATQLPSMPIAHRRVKLDDGIKFLRIFGKPERLLNCDCERNDNTTMVQALQFITGPIINRAVHSADNRIGRLLKAGKSNSEIVNELFLAALCRLPSDEVRSALVARIEKSSNRREALEDVMWALLNSKEFLLRK